MRILVCGDLHTKLDILKKVEKKAPDYDKIIFLGDYVDDWDAKPEKSYELLNELIVFKKNNLKKVVLLLGNHDFSEWKANEFACSGFNPITHLITEPIFEENEQYFEIAYLIKDILFSHAGVTNAWATEAGIADFSNESLADYLSLTLTDKYDRPYSGTYRRLASVGYARGGYENPSPLWADYMELNRDPLPKINQVVGHSPVAAIKVNPTEDGYYLIFCDTHSTTRNHENIGDNTLLELEIDPVGRESLTKNDIKIISL